jgi:energy-coupling factor transporter ATP-binding protein EcfA2
MPESSLYPRGLLTCPEAERHQYFSERTVMHSEMERVCGDLLDIVLEPSGTSLVFLVGPTGCGKSTIRRLIEKRIAEHLMPELLADAGKLPWVSVEVPAPESSTFPWKDFYKRILRAMEDPFVEQNQKYCGVRRGHRTAGDSQAQFRGDSAQELRYAVEQAFQHRRPAAVLLDEAEHFLKIPSGKKLLDQMDVIKSIANMTNVVQVLIGTYDLIAFLNLSGQLSRRSTVIHFPRYHAEDTADIRLFGSVVLAFQRHMPFEEEPNLLPHIEYLYARSIGCVGILKDWLLKAYGKALNTKARTLNLFHLKATALSVIQCSTMLSEARAGEGKLTEDKNAEIQLAEKLGMRLFDLETSGETPNPAKARRRSLRPGERKPTRDSVGIEKYAA